MGLLVLVSLIGPPGPSQADDAPPLRRDVYIRDVPFHRQEPAFPAEACLHMWLEHLGEKTTQHALFDLSGASPARGRGMSAGDLLQLLKKLNLDPGPAETLWQRFATADAPARLDELFDALLADLHRGRASIVAMRFDLRPDAPEHFRLILGYDATRDELICHDPASPSGKNQRIKREVFYRLWAKPVTADTQGVVRFPLARGKAALPQPPQPTIRRIINDRGQAQRLTVAPLTPANFVQQVIAIRRDPPIAGLHFAVSPPFVLASTMPADRLEQLYANRLVRLTVRRLKEAYFQYDPTEPITIYLLKTNEAYRTVARAVTRKPPSTPFGFYLPARNIMVMNAATGGGTLVHEIVHPFLDANFPNAPPWFDEGLASLYEQSTFQDGRITGLVNWRLPALQQAIRTDTLPTLDTLLRMDDKTFYGPGQDLHYAMARYLCYYLQQQGKLREFYRIFHRDQLRDATGKTALREVLGVNDLGRIQKQWQSFCLELSLQP